LLITAKAQAVVRDYLYIKRKCNLMHTEAFELLTLIHLPIEIGPGAEEDECTEEDERVT